MAIYCFHCEKCDCIFEDICSFSDSKKQTCKFCKKKVKRLISSRVSLSFSQPHGTSKWDNFEYRAGYNMEKAKKERAAAELVAKGNTQPYRDFNDLANQKNFDHKNWQ